MEENVKLDPHCEMMMQEYLRLRPTLQQIADDASEQLRNALNEQGIYITALQYLCMVNVLKHGGGRDGLKSLYDLLNGESDANGMIADMMMEQAQALPFMQKKK